MSEVASDSTQSRPLEIRPTRGWGGLELKELWHYRELIYFFIWRDVKVRYKQTVLGAMWAILQPFVTMVIFSVFFGYLAGLPSDGIPYPLFTYTALLPWQLFESGISKAGNSLVLGRNLITKVYFPRISMPIASVLSGMLDFAFAFVVLIGMMFYYSYPIRPQALILVPLILLSLVTALGAGVWLSALNVAYRDVGYLIPFIMRVWFFATPVTYSANLVPESLRPLYALNPMTGVVEGFRWALLETGSAPSLVVLASTGAALLMLITGVYYFRRMERTFADVV
jgi:lipopolysaccharide transport system permease protein